MYTPKRFLFVLLIVIITPLMLVDSPENSKATEDAFNHPSNIQERPRALFCLYQEECGVKPIERKAVQCEPYHPKWGEEANCTYTDENLDQISLITDQNNYITGEFSDKKFQVDYIHHNNTGPMEKIIYSGLEFKDDGSYVMVTSLHSLTHYNSEHEKLSSARLGDFIDHEEIMENSSVVIKEFAFDPNYQENKQIYVYYYLKKDSVGWSWAEQKKSRYYDFRVSRFEYRPGSENVFSNKKLFLEADYPRAHMGGGVEIGPDGKLYVSIGDGTIGKNAQNLSNPRGKILRINRDGTVPEDNPFNDSFIYSYGHRNPQSLSWHPETGTLYSSEHGPKRHDEINRIESGGNYGWPHKKCSKNRKDQDKESTAPIRCYKNWSLAPSGGTFVHEKNHPWYGNLFLTGLRGNHVRSFDVENGEIEDEKIFFYSKTPENNISRRFRDIEYFNESLYVVGDYQGLAKLTPIEERSWIAEFT